MTSQTPADDDTLDRSPEGVAPSPIRIQIHGAAVPSAQQLAALSAAVQGIAAVTNQQAVLAQEAQQAQQLSPWVRATLTERTGGHRFINHVDRRLHRQ